MNNRTIMSLLVFGLAFLSLNAQDKKLEARSQRHTGQKEMKAYVEQEVKPVIASQRAKLDNYLSKKEQKEIEVLRIEMKELRKASMEFRRSIKESYTGPNSLSEEQELKSRELKKTKRLLDTRAWAIADAHESEIAQLLDELDPNMKTWEEELREIRQKHAPERSGDRQEFLKNAPQKEQMMKNRRGERPEGFRKGGGRPDFRPGGSRGMNLRQLKSPLGFLLWDSKAELPYESNMPEMNTFPNPASAVNTLEFSLKKSGPVRVNILNDKGELVKTLIDEKREIGTYTEKFDLSEFDKGLYIYQIKTEDGISTKKLIIEK